MDYYELPAEGRGYYMFDHRPLMNAKAHFHSAVEFIFMEKGYAEVNVGERRLLSAARPASRTALRHSYVDNPDNLVYVFLGDRNYFDPFFRERSGRVFPRFFPFSDFGFLQTLYGLCGLPRGDGAASRTVFGGAAQILLASLAEKIPLVKRENDKQSAFVCEILKYAQSHVEEELSLSVLSDRFGYSREHLSRILHKYLTETWNAYVNGLRVQKAEALLKADEEKNVLKIAYECGFDSQNTFYRAYKKEFGPSRRAVGTKKINHENSSILTQRYCKSAGNLSCGLL
ncbi:MAG: helix-turn-helix transcriptional regulator [Christensenellaceae bacterium]